MRFNKKITWEEKPCQYPELGNCWECTSHKTNKSGYPMMYSYNHEIRIHRYVYQEKYGEIPKDMVIMHKCDNRKCINPEHLKLGTLQENNQDRINKGRSGNRYWKNGHSI
jgi:hypothetical protein